MSEKKKHTLSKQQKEEILETARTYLQSYSNILFAFVHGSFLEENIAFNDIDIAVYFDEANSKHDLLDLCLELSVRLSSLLGKQVDVHALNNSSIGFCYEVTRGKLLFTRNEEISLDFIESTRMKYFDFKPLMEENLKDLLLNL